MTFSLIIRLFACSLTLCFAIGFSPLHASSSNLAVVMKIEGPIGPAVSDFVDRSLEEARSKGARLIALEMDTPGGLDTSMREIIQDILSSPIPIIVYVNPRGARAASAGAYILYASHLAAMAPGTNVGAATPVQISTPVTPGNFENQDSEKTKPGMEEKIMADSVAYIKSLADIQGRNKEWAEKFITEAASISAEEALEYGVIEIKAEDIKDLLKQANGRQVKLLGNEFTLDTNNLTLVEIEPDWRTELLEIITNPNIAYLLLIVGIYGLIFEFMNPGTIAPGVIGTIALLLGLYALHILPINYTGLALILLGVAFMITEAYMPSFGAFGIGGIIAFVVGSILLLDTDVPGFQIYWPLILMISVFSGVLLMSIAGMAIRSQGRPTVIGKHTLLGKKGRVLVWRQNQGMIKVQGETWRAKSDDNIKPGDNVVVEDAEGLILTIKKQQGEPNND